MNTNSEAAPMQILHLEDSSLDHDLVCKSLARAGIDFKISRVDTLIEFESLASSRAFDVILADYRLTGFTAIDAWECLSGMLIRPPFILLSGAIGEAAAVAAIKTGVSDYVLKSDLGRLARVIQRALEVHTARLEKERAHQELAESERQLANFAEHLQNTIEQERASIAREVHDDIGGALAAVKLDLAWIGRRTLTPEIQTHIAAAVDMLNHAIGASQRIMRDLRPAILDQGLVAAVNWLVSNFEKRTGIKTMLRAHAEDIELSKSIQLTAYRTAQEALTNISKHAVCNLVKLDLTLDTQFLTLEISDGGPGIRSSDREKPKAFGLRGMQERAKNVGGWLDISTSSSGTSITLSVPITPEPNPSGQIAAV